jgi:hypothetical protein
VSRTHTLRGRGHCRLSHCLHQFAHTRVPKRAQRSLMLCLTGSRYTRSQDLPSNMPPTSCRAGQVVHLLNDSGGQLPVRLKIGHKDDPTAGPRHVIQVRLGHDATAFKHRLVRISHVCRPSDMTPTESPPPRWAYTYALLPRPCRAPQVFRAAPDDELSEKRITLAVDFTGNVRGSGTGSADLRRLSRLRCGPCTPTRGCSSPCAEGAACSTR